MKRRVRSEEIQEQEGVSGDKSELSRPTFEIRFALQWSDWEKVVMQSISEATYGVWTGPYVPGRGNAVS